MIKTIKLDTVISTNNYAKDLILNDEVFSILIIAKKQTAGRGRSGHTWKSTENGLYMSIVNKLDGNLDMISRLTIVAGIAVYNILLKNNIEIKLKWVNDIMLKNKKVGGILTEYENGHLIVGIGINMDYDFSNDDLADKAIAINDKHIDNDILANDIANEFFDLYNIYINQKNLDSLIEQYKKICITLNNNVKIIKEHTQQIGYAQDINSRGELIVKLDNGEIITVIAGEVSVRGMNGYI